MEVYAKRNSELLIRCKNGDKSAKELLCRENMGLVKKAAAGFAKSGVPLEDLIQTGAIGLIKAIDNFDITLGVCFSTYAVPLILGEIKRFLRDDGLIKVSRSMKQSAAKGIKAREDLKKELGREPTIGEIAERSGIDAEELICSFEAMREPESINRELYEDSGETLENSITRGDYEDQITDRIMIEEMLDNMTTKERKVIVLRYFKDKSQQEIAKVLGVSQVQVSRIEKKVLEKMRLYKF